MLSTKAFLIRIVVGVLLTLALLAAALYWFVFVYTINVVNLSGQTLTRVQLLMPGITRQLGTMPPGDSRWAFIQPTRDGVPGLSFYVAGQLHREEDKGGYISAADGGRMTVTVQPSSRVTFEY